MSSRIRSIVVGVALTDEPDPLLPTAVRLAESIGALLHVVHVLPLPDVSLTAGDAGVGLLAPDRGFVVESTLAAEAALRRHCDRLAVAPQRIKIHVTTGSAHHQLTLLAESVDADLLVVGPTRHGPVWRAAIGTTAERVLRASTVPVLVVHQPFFHPVERILLTTDLSQHSVEAHERGLDTAEALFAESALVCTSVFAVAAPPSWPMAVETAQLNGQVEMECFLSERDSRRYRIVPRVRIGEPASVINVEADAWGADLIVLGTHGRHGLARYAFGSVAADTVRDATRNILVIPAGPRQLRASAYNSASVPRRHALAPRPVASEHVASEHGGGAR